MTTPKLQNYLRMYRKRTGLSQDAVASLFGTQSDTKVSRYENFVRQATLKTALPVEAILRVPVRELFADIQEEVVGTTRRRVALITARIPKEDPDRLLKRKLEHLRSVVVDAESCVLR